MGVYLGQRSRTPLREMARYDNKLIKVADRIVRTSELSKNRPPLSAVAPNKSYASAVMLSDDDGQKNLSDSPSKT